MMVRTLGPLRKLLPWIVANVNRFFVVFVGTAALSGIVVDLYEEAGFDFLSYLPQIALATVQLSGILLLPAIPYLIIIANLPAGWSLVSKRLVAVGLSPLIAAWLIAVLATQDHVFEPAFVLYEFAFPVVYGLVVRLPSRVPGNQKGSLLRRS